MNKSDLIAKLVEKNIKRADAEKAVNTVIESVTDALVNGDRVQLIGFGSFEVKTRPAREARNPRTGETVEASKAPIFKAGKALKDAVNK